eukprot:ANDGO_00163.mRNA.1 hypothetical protein
MSEDFEVMEEYLSDAALTEICGTSEFSKVRKIEMFVDTNENSLSQLGDKLPSLAELKLSHSVLLSIRDLGTSLRNLRVLWISHCGLHDLEGIAALQNLTELYAAFNNIEDLSPLTSIDKLQVLDIEGCSVSDPDSLSFLSHLDDLHTVSAIGNPMVSHPQFRDKIREYCPHVDDIDASMSGDLGLDNEVSLLTDVIKRITPSVGSSNSFDPRPPSSVSSSSSTSTSSSNSRSRPMSARPASARPLSARGSNKEIMMNAMRSSYAFGESKADDQSSDLTFGTAEVFAGNAARSLRNRKLESASASSPTGTQSPKNRVFRCLSSNGGSTNASVSASNEDVLEAIKAVKEQEEIALRSRRRRVAISSESLCDELDDDTVDGFIYDDDSENAAPSSMAPMPPRPPASTSPPRAPRPPLPSNAASSSVSAESGPVAPQVMVGRLRPSSARQLKSSLNVS